MIDLIDLKTYLQSKLPYQVDIAPEQLPEETQLENAETKVYLDYAPIQTSLEETLLESASQLGTSCVQYILCVVDVKVEETYQDLPLIMKELQGYQPVSFIKNVRTLSFHECHWERSNNRRLAKLYYAFTFDRFFEFVTL